MTVATNVIVLTVHNHVLFSNHGVFRVLLFCHRAIYKEFTFLYIPAVFSLSYPNALNMLLKAPDTFLHCHKRARLRLYERVVLVNFNILILNYHCNTSQNNQR